MSFDVHIRNLGKLADATVKVAPLTVLAGPNNTGKSYFSKMMYSVLHAAQGNHTEAVIQNIISPLFRGVSTLEYGPEESKNGGDVLGSSIRKLTITCESLSKAEDEFSAAARVFPDIAKIAGEIAMIYNKLRPSIKAVAETKSSDSPVLPLNEDDFKAMDVCAESLASIEKRGVEDIILSGLGNTIQNNLIGNFQTPLLSRLAGDAQQKISVNIEKIMRLENQGERIVSSIDPGGLVQLKRYSKIIYLETPVHWKLKKALESASKSLWLLFDDHQRKRLNVPKYFHDLNAEWNESYSGEVAFPDLLDRLKKSMRGQIVISESEGLVFQEIGRKSPVILPMTATGVINLGILALLIEAKILDKGAFLFIDEPEAHLHPRWQVEMIRALFYLAQHGVNVIIATHSSDILECLSSLVKENPKMENMIALNHFSYNEGEGAHVIGSTTDFVKHLDAVQKELTEPFYESYLNGF